MPAALPAVQNLGGTKEDPVRLPSSEEAMDEKKSERRERKREEKIQAMAEKLQEKKVSRDDVGWGASTPRHEERRCGGNDIHVTNQHPIRNET